MTTNKLFSFAALLMTAFIASGQAPAAKTDPEAAAFRETIKHLDMDGNLLMYVNPSDVTQVMDKAVTGIKAHVVPLLADGNPNRKQFIIASQNLLDSLYKTSGLRDIRGLGVSNRKVGDGMYQAKAFLHLDPESKGKFRTLLGSQPKPLDYLSVLPKTTVGASVIDFDVTDLWKWHFELVQATGDGQLAGIHGMIMGGLRQKFEIDKLLASTSGTFGIVVTLDPAKELTVPMGRQAQLKMPSPGIALFAKVKDNSIKDFMLSKMTKRVDGKVQPMAFTDTTVKGVVIRTFDFPKTPFPFSPSIGTIGDYLAVSSTKELLTAMVEAATTGNGLKAEPKFKKMMQGMPTEGNGFAFSDPLLNETVYDVQTQMAALAPGKRKEAMEAVMKAYPMNRGIAGVSVLRWEPTGLAVVGNSSISAPQAFAEEIVKLAAWAGGMALPRVTKGAARAKQAKCTGNLKQIGLGLLMYAGDNKGAFPDDLAVLMEKEYLKQGSVFVCPSTPAAVPKNAADVRAGACGYVYLGKGLRDDNPKGMNTIIAHDKPANHGSSIGFLFIDGHVETVKTKDPKQTAKERGWVLPAAQ